MILALSLAALAALAAFLVWRAAGRIWDVVAIAALAGVAFPVVATWLTGDVSRYLPNAFSDGIEGKDQIIVVSALSTILVAVALAAGFWWLAKSCWRVIGRSPS